MNLNDKNGLPTNFIYDIDVDKYGYLWIGTPKGVVKYNGYEAKTFDFSSGLPNEDIWCVYADEKGRLWCGTHGNKLCYIQNDKIVLLTNAGFNAGLYPRHIQQFKNGIAWAELGKFYYEKNDTLYRVKLSSTISDFIDEDNILHTITEEYRQEKITNPDSFPKKTYFKNNRKTYAPRVQGAIAASLGKDLVICIPSLDTLWIGTPDSNFTKNYNYIFRKKPQIISAFEKKGTLNLRYDIGFVTLDKKYQPIDIILFDKSWLKNIDGNKIPIALWDPLWDTCVATNTQGLFIINNQKTFLKSLSNELKDYKIIKKLSNNSVIWWNPIIHKAIILKNGVTIDSFNIPKLQLQSAADISSDRLLLFTSGLDFWYFPNLAKLIPLPKEESYSYVYSVAFDKERKYFYSLKDVWLRKSVLRDTSSKDSFLSTPQPISDARYKELLYDKYYEINIAYKHDEILFISNKKNYQLKASFLNKIGIHNIERIRTDNKGNLFIKDNKKIVCVNFNLNVYKKIYTHSNFGDATMEVNNNLLVVAGSFGVAFYKIDSALTFPHCIHRNTKNLYYNHLYYLQVNDKDVFFTTDEDCFTVAIPTDSEFSLSQLDDLQYKLLLKYKESTYLSGGKDTIRISQNSLMLDFDVINPAGNGKVIYSYSVGDGWEPAAGNQLFLTELVPGVYTSLSVIVKDKSWISGKNNFTIYIIPFWWQTDYGKIIIALCFIIFIVLVAFTVYLITKVTAKKRNERNQLRMDIELKSIYSQINPHFIFNTLSGTQYFIRENQTQQARLHLNKFSRLLRSYIHSSRNKYITIKDEMSNLINYIELQQIRFADKFDYEIVIAEDLPVEAIKIPSLLLQPLVENAINHGLFHVEGYKGLLKIEFSLSKETDEIICIIDDNGIGRKKAKEIKADSIVKTESYGDALIKDLINIFNKYEKLNIKIEYTDKQPPQSGTTVTLKIKNPVYEKKS